MKLLEELKEQIRQDIIEGVDKYDIARKYGISLRTYYRIKQTITSVEKDLKKISSESMEEALTNLVSYLTVLGTSRKRLSEMCGVPENVIVNVLNNAKMKTKMFK